MRVVVAESRPTARMEDGTKVVAVPLVLGILEIAEGVTPELVGERMRSGNFKFHDDRGLAVKGVGRATQPPVVTNEEEAERDGDED